MEEGERSYVYAERTRDARPFLPALLDPVDDDRLFPTISRYNVQRDEGLKGPSRSLSPATPFSQGNTVRRRSLSRRNDVCVNQL